MAANNSYQEAVALVAAANRVVQDPNSVGSALRTISLRLRGTSMDELNDAGEDTTGAVTSKSKLRSKVKALSGVDILTNTGAYKSTYEILLEISRVWENMSDIDQAALLEIIAGKTRSNTAAAILSNTADLENAYVDALNAEGSALRENEKYLDSIQGRIDLFTNAVQTMWNNLLDDGMIKWFVDLAKNIIKSIDWINERFSILGTTIVSLGSFKGLKALFSAFNIGGKFTAFINAISGNTMKEAWRNLKNLSAASSEVTASTLALRVETGKMTAVEAVRQAATHRLVLSRIALTDVEAKELLSTTALTETEKQAIVTKLGLDATSKRLTLTKLQEAVADGKLTTSEALHMAISSRLIATQTSLTAAKATDILTSKGVEAAEAEQIITKLGLGTVTKTLTSDIILQAVASGTLTSSQGALALSLLATTGAAKGLKGAIISLWTAIWPMLVLAGAAAIIYGIVKAIDKAVVTNDELTESIENTRSEIESIKSEIDSLNDQLEETQDRIAELIAMPSLSFTEEEELENLKQQNAELERTLELQKVLKAQKEAKLKADTKTQIENTWNGTSRGKSDYSIDANGVISNDSFWTKAISGKDALDKAFEKYKEYDTKKTDLETLYQQALKETTSGALSKETYKAISEATGNYIPTGQLDNYYQNMLDTAGQEEYLKNFKENVIDNTTQTLQDISDGISLVISDMADNAEGLSYGDDEEINTFLDELNYYNLKWQETQGISATSSAIKAMFDDTQNQAVKNIETKLKEIAISDEYANTEEGNAQRIADATKVVENAYNSQTDAYDRLKTAMDTMGWSAEQVARSFVQLSQAPDSDSIEGIIKQYQQGVDAFKRLRTDSEKELSNLGQGGNVDLLNRPQISTSKLVQAGWKNVGDGIATVFSSTYSNEDGTVALNFTPILPDGSVLSPTELQRYAEDVIARVRQDDLGLQIGARFNGENAIEQAEYAANRIHELQDTYYLDNFISYTNSDGNEEQIYWTDLYDWDEETQTATAKSKEIAKILQGTSEEVREEFSKLVEDVAEGKKTFDEVISEFNLLSFQAVIESTKEDLSLFNGDVFKDIKDDLSGLIDTFDELSKALDSVASSMDLLHTAQEQMNSSGRISIQTALSLIETTDNWDQVLNITNGTVTLAANAEEILIQTKLDAIKANIDLAIQEVETQIALLEGAVSSSKAGNTFTKNFTGALINCQGVLFGLKAAWNAFWSGGDVVGAFNNARNSVINQTTQNTADLSDLYSQREKLYAQKDLLGNVDTVEEFKNNYDYTKTPGDKYTDSGDADTIKDIFDKLAAKYDREIELLSNEKERIQAEIDKQEARGEIASQSYYERLIELEEAEKQKLIEKKKALEDYLKVNAKNVTEEEWSEMNNEINDTALAIKTCEQNVIDFGNAIEDIRWEYFNSANDEIDSLAEEIQWLNGLLDDEKMANDDGTWTQDAITRMALYESQMEYAAVMAERYKKEIDNIGKSWSEYQELLSKYGDANSIPEESLQKIQDAYGSVIQSESEYQEKLRELEGKQRDMIDSYEDAKDGIIDLNKARVDAINDGIQKEIDAFSELIELKKEELEAERDLYSFKKSTEKQTKSIAETQRKIASLSGSTSASDIAELRKLQATLRGQQEELNDSYYEHAMSAQETALDNELEAYKKSREEYLETLEESLDNAELIIAETLQAVMLNADTAYAGLQELASNYNINVSPELMEPWEKAAAQATTWKLQLGYDLEDAKTTILDPHSEDVQSTLGADWDKLVETANKYTTFLSLDSNLKIDQKLLTGLNNQIQTIIDKWNGVKAAAEEAAKAQLATTNAETPKTVSGTTTTATSTTSTNTGNGKNVSTYSATVAALQEFLNDCWGQRLDITGQVKNGKYDNETAQAVREMQKKIGAEVDGKYGPDTVKKLTQYYDNLIANNKKYGGSSSMVGQGIQKLEKYKSKIPVSFYAKGTMGATKDHWAVTDEPQWGDELTLIPGKSGNLSFIRKGTSVIPADLTKELMDIGSVGLDGIMNSNNVGSTISMINNAVSKPEYNFSFEALVKADRIDESTLPAVKSMVQTELNKFMKQLNYSIAHC